MSGFELFDGDTKMRITEGSRTVFTTDGTLINLLPPEDDISLSFSIAFPDFTKDFLYNWLHEFSWNSGPQLVGMISGCATQLTIPEQNFAAESNLVAAPADADIFVGKILLNRTTAPSHTWNADTIDPIQPMNSQIPFISGSLLMEAQIGMVRACSIYVSGGQLKLHRQQSISTPPGGWGIYGTSFVVFSPASGSGGENVYGSQAGIPVHAIQSLNTGSKTYPRNSAPPYDEEARYGVGVSQCSVSTSGFNYASAYSATLVGSFGRRS